MDSKSMTRKDFFVLTFSLVGSAVVASNCGSSSGGGGTGGTTGTGGKGTGGGTGTGGRGTGGGTGTGGSGTGGGTGTGGSTGTGGRDGGGTDTPGTDAGNDVPVNNDSGPADTGPIDAANNCSDPLSETQFTQAGDNTNHTHAFIVPASTLNATTAQTINTEPAGAGDGHIHAVTFSPADLTTLRGGGIVEIRSASGANHTHSYRVGCHPLPDAGADTGPVDATVG